MFRQKWQRARQRTPNVHNCAYVGETNALFHIDDANEEICGTKFAHHIVSRSTTMLKPRLWKHMSRSTPSNNVKFTREFHFLVMCIVQRQRTSMNCFPFVFYVNPPIDAWTCGAPLTCHILKRSWPLLNCANVNLCTIWEFVNPLSFAENM